MDAKHYLYRHIRLDTNEVFYIGIGTKPKYYSCPEKEYKRAYTCNYRNNHWKNIVNQTEYKVDIILESDDYSFIQKQEIEFIKFYGRKDLDEGLLVNYTGGGEGYLNPSDITRQRMSNRRKGKKLSKETRLKLSKALKNPSKETRRKMGEAKKGNNNPMKSKDVVNKVRKILSKPVLQFTKNGEFIQEWSSQTDAAKELNLYQNSISNVCSGKQKTSGGFIWRFKK